MRITNCKVNHMVNPVGYYLEQPTFSWQIEEASGRKQISARIRVSLNPDMLECILDTDYRPDIDHLAYLADLALLPRTCYYWTVSVQSDAGEVADSPLAYFETGKMNEPWSGKWITCSNTTSRHPIFTKSMDIGPNIKSARLYICGLGLYEAYLNGEKIGTEFLTPYCNNYNQWLQYQTYDITDQLACGGNLSVLLGNGWYKGRFGFQDITGKGFYGDSWMLIAEIHITYADGLQQVIQSDQTWNVTRSKTTFSNIYDGEHQNDSLSEDEAEQAKLCTGSQLPKGILSERMSTPVTIHEEINPVEVMQTPAGETVLDLGQNFAGVFKLRVREPKGAQVHLQFGEVLQDGNFYRDNLRSAKAEYIYISDGTEKIITPHFTFYGYRYVKIEGIQDFREGDFTGLALYSQLPQSGHLTTGNKLVNQLISNTLWGLKSNFIDVPTDCPQRDERMGWTGDAQVFTPTACYLTDSFAFYAKYLCDIADEQKEHNGMVPDVIPSFGMTSCSSVWGDAVCIIPWKLFQFYGDKNILVRQFASMKSWVDYITSLEENNSPWGAHFHYGDWLALDNLAGGSDQVFGGTDVDFIAYVYYMNSADIVADTADLLGAHEDCDKYRALAGKIRKYIQNEFYSPNGRCCINTQTALLLTLKYNLSANTEWIKARLQKRFAENGNMLQTGFVGTPIMCGILSENDMSELAYQLLLNEKYPGWMYSIKLGATTIWERWNSILEDGSISSSGMNSLNHYSYGSIVEWLYAYCAGIRQQDGSVGFRKALLAPVLNGQINYIDAVYHSAAGTYKFYWKIYDPNHVEMKISIPFDCEAKLVLPNLKPGTLSGDIGEEMSSLTAGEYSIRYETTHYF